MSCFKQMTSGLTEVPLLHSRGLATGFHHASVLAFILFGTDCGGPSGPSPLARDIIFLDSTPAPGSTVVISDPRSLVLRFSVLYDSAIPQAQLEVEFFDANGTDCAFNFTDEQDVIADSPSTFVSDFFVWESRDCPLPRPTSTVKVTLLTLRDTDGAYLERTEYLAKAFPVGYTFERYPPPPANAPPSAPVIATLDWKVLLPTGGDPPIPGDPTNVRCEVRDEDGDAVTVTLTLTWTGASPRSVSQSFPPGASSSPEGASLSHTEDALDPPTATFSCVAVDARGNSVTRTATIP